MEIEYGQAPGSSDGWPDDWFERALVRRAMLAKRAEIERIRAQQAAALALMNRGA